MVLPILRTAGAGIARFFGKSTTRAAAGGAIGGVLLDDIPVIGPTLDPTEGDNGGVEDVLMLAVLAVAGLLALTVVVDK